MSFPHKIYLSTVIVASMAGACAAFGLAGAGCTPASRNTVKDAVVNVGADLCTELVSDASNREFVELLCRGAGNALTHVRLPRRAWSAVDTVAINKDAGPGK